MPTEKITYGASLEPTMMKAGWTTFFIPFLNSSKTEDLVHSLGPNLDNWIIWTRVEPIIIPSISCWINVVEKARELRYATLLQANHKEKNSRLDINCSPFPIMHPIKCTCICKLIVKTFYEVRLELRVVAEIIIPHLICVFNENGDIKLCIDGHCGRFVGDP
ncbi:hypothetical protein H8356DRAFT_1351784 [Neocallimastix lanati (nom. inval.)]|nr:hypothetical protein H8356DRAFT_1351784 [Neocallimastix sp. JGI-2020a]